MTEQADIEPIDIVLGDNYLYGFNSKFPSFLDSMFPPNKVSFTQLCQALETQHGAALMFRDKKPYGLRFKTESDKMMFVFRYSSLESNPYL